MSKRKKFLIIGGGISGLSVLHFLRKRFVGEKDVEITLIEKESFAGGTIRTVRGESSTFDEGPNGFLSNKKDVIDLCSELGLTDKLVVAARAARKRFIYKEGKLLALPSNPLNFITTGVLGSLEKGRLLCEPFIRQKGTSGESVYQYGCRRFGRGVAEKILDPMMSGIFGGDARSLIFEEVFPKLARVDKEYGSLFIGAMKGGFKDRSEKPPKGNAGKKPLRLLTLAGGMSCLIEALGERYKDQIHLGTAAESITKEGAAFCVTTSKSPYKADQIFLSLPAYGAAKILSKVSVSLAALLEKVFYAPIVVVGLVYQRKNIGQPPVGYGYLVPSMERRKTLGVLFTSSIFPDRTKDGLYLFRVMLGGARQASILEYSKEKLIDLAKEEIRQTLAIKSEPHEVHLSVWPKAIPQYDNIYYQMKEELKGAYGSVKGLTPAANYIGGISLGDCISNAKARVRDSCD